MNPIFLSLRIFGLAAIILWFVIYWKFGLLVIIDLCKTLPHRKTRRDGILMAMITLMSMIIWVSALLIILGRTGFSETPLSQGAAVFGLLMTLSGISGTFYARHQLGRLWTAAAGLQSAHRVIDQGLYAWVRHPIYTFAMLLNFGFCLIFPTWWTIPATVIILLSYALKAQGEEELLLHSLDGYPDYMRRVPYRIFPKLW